MPVKPLNSGPVVQRRAPNLPPKMAYANGDHLLLLTKVGAVWVLQGVLTWGSLLREYSDGDWGLAHSKDLFHMSGSWDGKTQTSGVYSIDQLCDFRKVT